MILTWAVVAGLLAGLARAWAAKRLYQPTHLKSSWLLVSAVFIQAVAFLIPATRRMLPDWTTAGLLVVSQGMLLAFVWDNRSKPGFWILGIGTAMNFLVILANGGLMPIDPQTAAYLFPGRPELTEQVGAHLQGTKDLLLPVASTRFWWLSDHFLSPPYLPSRFAFSPGDVLIALGVFKFLWVQGGPIQTGEEHTQQSILKLQERSH